jgi:hypothetical protein
MTVSSVSTVYGAALPTFSMTITGLVNGDVRPGGNTGTGLAYNNGDTLSGTVIGTLSLATAATSSSSVGTYPITAGIVGLGLASSNYSLNVVPGTLTVGQSATTTTLISSGSPSALGQIVTLTASATPSTATGTMTFKDGSTTLGSGTLTGGVATFSASSLIAGLHSLTAVYSGDSNYSLSTSSTLTQTVSALVAVTLQTSPTGLLVSVDDAQAQATPFTLQLATGSHNIAVLTTQGGSTGKRYVFTGWSDTGPASHGVSVTNAVTYTASFKTQYQLTMAVLPSGGGSVAPNPGSADGYYDSGTPVSLAASANANYSFNSWGGSISGPVNPQTITMDQVSSVTANFLSTLAPAVTISAAATGTSGSKTYTLTLKNTGAGDAINVAVSLTPKVMIGSGTLTVTGAPPATIAAATTVVIPLNVTITGTVTQFTLTTSVTAQDTGGKAYTWTAASKLTP